MTRHTTRVAVHGMFVADDKILLIRRKDTGYFDGYFGLPAGHLEPRELPRDAMVRECAEEVGLNVIKAEFALVVHHIKPEPNPTYTHYFFLATSWSGEPRNMEPDKCSELRWVDIEGISRDDVITYIHQAVKAWQLGLKHSYFIGP